MGVFKVNTIALACKKSSQNTIERPSRNFTALFLCSAMVSLRNRIRNIEINDVLNIDP